MLGELVEFSNGKVAVDWRNSLGIGVFDSIDDLMNALELNYGDYEINLFEEDTVIDLLRQILENTKYPLYTLPPNYVPNPYSYNPNVTFTNVPSKKTPRVFPVDSREPTDVEKVKSPFSVVFVREILDGQQLWIASTKYGGDGNYYSWYRLNNSNCDAMELVEYDE
jgi:hypothetical protein